MLFPTLLSYWPELIEKGNMNIRVTRIKNSRHGKGSVIENRELTCSADVVAEIFSVLGR